MDLSSRRPEIEYPCVWNYQVIGTSEARLRDAIAGAVPDREHSITLTNTSRTGKYTSLLLEIEVDSEAQRLTIFYRIAEHDDVRMVI
jgi:hypothetical protein